ncbi:MAG: TonB-dependent receptor family protein [Prevotella sp.]|nr:TonB-dependent receptor family protein [Prevotella sp.]
MRKSILTALFLGITMCLCAQHITRNYQDVSLSKVLEDLNNISADKTIYFIYDELEDFTVSCYFKNYTLEQAIREVIGFYPMKVTFDNDRIFIECTQKAATKLSGHIVDKASKPIPLANVTLLLSNDSTFITGGVSNDAGDFVVPCSTHQVIVRISCIGYKTVERKTNVTNIGTIMLQDEAYIINGVEVKGSVPQYRMTSGGMTVEVQHSILHDVGTADDLLSMMPLVQGRDGKFEVLAKGEPEIYINNKKVRDVSELKQLKSVDIKSVDIITAPGAKYNAEVNAIIHIKTLKTQGDGFSLMATSQTWRNNKWNNNDDLTMKYRTGGLEAFANVAFDWGHFSNEQDLEQKLHISKDIFDIRVDLPLRSRWATFQYKAGLSYDLNADHSVGLSFSSQTSLFGHMKTEMNQHYQKNGAFYGDIVLEMNADEIDKPVWELNTYYIGKMGKLGIDLNATVLRRESEDHLYQQEYSQELGDRPITTVNSEKNTMAAGKLILTYPVWKGELSFGSEATSTQSHGNNYNQENIIPEADNEMKEKNIAGFAQYELSFNVQSSIFNINAGLRYEHVSSDYTSFGIWQSEPSRNYNDWFPNLSAAWRKGKLGAQLSYSKRITRPQYNMLSSIIVYDSRMLYEGGNPLLRPSVRQSIDLNLTYSWLTFVTGFTRENNFFTHIGQVYDEVNEIGIFRPANFDHQDRVYATLVASPKYGFWQPTATLHYYQQMFDAEAYGAPMKLNKPEFSFNLLNWFVINPKTKAMIQAGYSGSSHWGFMYRYSYFIMNARLQKTFWKGRLTGTLYANDIFRTAGTKVNTYYDIGKTVQDVYSYTQQVGLTLSYNFNVTHSKYRGTGAGNDEKNRL